MYLKLTRKIYLRNCGEQIYSDVLGSLVTVLTFSDLRFTYFHYGLTLRKNVLSLGYNISHCGVCKEEHNLIIFSYFEFFTKAFVT